MDFFFRFLCRIKINFCQEALVINCLELFGAVRSYFLFFEIRKLKFFQTKVSFFSVSLTLFQLSVGYVLLLKFRSNETFEALVFVRDGLFVNICFFLYHLYAYREYNLISGFDLPSVPTPSLSAGGDPAPQPATADLPPLEMSERLMSHVHSLHCPHLRLLMSVSSHGDCGSNGSIALE